MNPPYTEREAIRNLQRYLRELSRYHPNISTVPIDGIFESQTAQSVRDFQTAFGLPVTGRADKRTWDALFAEYLRLLEANDRTPRVHLFPKSPEKYEASLGEESAFVTVLQLLLAELSTIYDVITPPSASGRFETDTERAVRAFQTASRLPVTGRVDLRTWNRMIRDFDHYAR